MYFRPGRQAVWTLFSSGDKQIRNLQASSFKMIPRNLGHPWGAEKDLQKQPKSRFLALQDSELIEIVSNAQAEGTKKQTRWSLKAFGDWCDEKGISKNTAEMTDEELDGHLYRFYAEARSKAGQGYSRSTLLGFRNAMERHLASEGRYVSITKNPSFHKSNKMLESKLKSLRRENKEKVQHKPVVEAADIDKIKESPFMSPTTPDGLLRIKDAVGCDYALMSHQEATRNHQGGYGDTNEVLTRLYSTNTEGDAYWCLKLYISKLNLLQEAFFQKPKQLINAADPVWYENKPLGVNSLAKMMKNISIGANLSKVYTNHSVRSTSITTLSNSGVPSRHIMAISGHKSEQSLVSYNSRPSTSQIKRFSEIISSAVGCEMESSGYQNKRQYSSSFSSVAYPNGAFQSCNISQAQIFVVPPKSYHK
ncbi:uncharacterized protein LOC116306345 [Actinia tenebrosa]|uniref:Uncharacterized protein LOC116306345 n=1 Tax=Actinia tenebrosa TaxID=6105 RepID=A0A6P8J3T0_ACTTE|nr:uncharacterized protein LOC116306345 [Actinia tenebrosa]